jgi:uncharacterized protein (TIGR00369 family)
MTIIATDTAATASATTPVEPGLSGIEQLRLVQRQGRTPIGDLIGMQLDVLAVGRVEFTLVPGPQHYNPIGTVHGGIAATLLDSAMGCAVHSTLPAGVRFTTVDLHVHYTRAMTADTGPVRAIGEIVHSGGRTATAEARLVDGDGRVLAHGTTTCLLLR